MSLEVAQRFSVGMAVMGWWLDLMAGLDALKDSMIL